MRWGAIEKGRGEGGKEGEIERGREEGREVKGGRKGERACNLQANILN